MFFIHIIKRNRIMKKFSKVNSLLCSLICALTYQSTNSNPNEFPKHWSKDMAAQYQHTIIKDLDGKIYECTQKYTQHFKNLTLTNLKEKAVHIENLRVELLYFIKRAEKRSHYQMLEQALETMDIKGQPMQAINDFKKILKILPETTRLLISNTITDPMIKGFLIL